MVRMPALSVALAPLFFCVICQALGETQKYATLRRQKRYWVPPPRKLVENKDYKNGIVVSLRSDKELEKDLIYTLSGAGASEEPLNLFVIDPKKGDVIIRGILDREKFAKYNLFGAAKYKNGQYAEKNINLTIVVEDVNDCVPLFGKTDPGSVHEQSPKGTFVTNVTATDDDEPGNLNSKIRYSIVSQNPSGEQMFYITPDGQLFVNKPTLDRETQDSYTLVVRGADLDGAPGGNTGTGTVMVNIVDINDNRPRLEKDHYEGNIEENTYNVEVMRFKAFDDDLENTDNWLAEYHIDSGNEGDYFTIETDPKTNEGILKLKRPVDFESTPHMDLKVSVENKAPFVDPASGVGVGVGAGAGGQSGAGVGLSSGWSSSRGESSGGKGKSYPVSISVKNQLEGPMFSPKTKQIPVSEDAETIDLKKPIARYPAIDEDTGKEAEKVRYAKGYDPDNWFTVDEKTGEIRLKKLPDRESKALVNGAYYGKVLCMSQDIPSKTATGTIAIQVGDINDHCPVLTSTSQSMCTDSPYVYVTAVDEDDDPNSAPFNFIIIKDNKGKWIVQYMNDTTAILKLNETVWPGHYVVALEVTDQQGLSCSTNQVLKINACTCNKNKVCAFSKSAKGAKLGVAGVALLFMGLLLLLLVPLLLLFCMCGAGGLGGSAFANMPFETKEHLIAYNTEGQGEDRDVPLLTAPYEHDGFGGGAVAAGVAGGMVSSSMMVAGANGMAGQAGGQMLLNRINSLKQGPMIMDHCSADYSGYDSMERSMFDGIGLPGEYLNDYYSQKAMASAGTEAQKDSYLMYDYEGQGSPVGSMGSCSFLESENDLQFLNDLGPKFKKLAEICGGVEITSEPPLQMPRMPVLPKMPEVSNLSEITKITKVKSNMSIPPPMSQVGKTTTVTNVATESRSNMTMKKPSPVVSSHVENHIVVDTSRTATMPSVQIRENVVVPNQTYLIQQPMYYTAAPVMQTRYVVEPQVQNTVLVAGAPAVSNMQAMYVVNGVPAENRVVSGDSGLITVQQGTLGRGESMVLLENGDRTGPAGRVGQRYEELVTSGGTGERCKKAVMRNDLKGESIHTVTTSL